MFSKLNLLRLNATRIPRRAKAEILDHKSLIPALAGACPLVGSDVST
ncbi:MAG: hypothetical protein ACTH58_10960 [Marinomonas foliarum]